MKQNIAIIGLGYVGLPLARLFATKYPVVGFDINTKRIAELNAGTDFTLEIEEDLLKSVLVNENPFGSKQESSQEQTGSQVHKFTGSQVHNLTRSQKKKI